MPLKDNRNKRFQLVRDGLSFTKQVAISAGNSFFNYIRINSSIGSGFYERLFINDGDFLMHTADKQYHADDPDGPGFLNVGPMMTFQAFNTTAGDLADSNVMGTIRWMGNDDGEVNLQGIDVYGQVHDITSASFGTTFWILTQKNKADAFAFELREDLLGVGRDVLTDGNVKFPLHVGGEIVAEHTTEPTSGDMINSSFGLWLDSDVPTVKVKNGAGATSNSVMDGSDSVPLAGGTMTGALKMSGTTNAGTHVSRLTTTQRNALSPSSTEHPVIWNTTNTQLEVYDGSSWQRLDTGGTRLAGKASLTKTYFHAPGDVIVSGEEQTIWRTDVAVTVQEMNATIEGTSPSRTWTIRHAVDRTSIGNEVVTSGNTTTTTSAVTSFNDATIPVNSWVWLECTASSGTVSNFSVSIRYTED